LDESRVHRVYYGVDMAIYRPLDPQQRAAGRAALNLPLDRPVIAFVGTLGWDRNKGFDTLFRAHQSLCEAPAWDPILVAAGAGADVDFWRREAHRPGLDGRVRMLGFSRQIPNLLAAADVMVAPSSYESYGLAVHEALCCQIPVIVSAAAGIAERYPDDLRELLLPSANDSADLALRLKRWRASPDRFLAPLARFGERLRHTSWQQMSEQMVELIQSESLCRDPCSPMMQTPRTDAAPMSQSPV
jgi:glycosyltransferase involved in cell wall biosynthesis